MVPSESQRVPVVFIAGLGHSGSTLLDLMLGSHSRMVGLGEVDNTLAGADFSPGGRRHSPRCACGKATRDCPLWGAVSRDISVAQELTPHERYDLVINVLHRLHGPEVIAVDSSKRLSALDLLRIHPGLEVRVVFLVRDVRSFIVSSLDNIARKRLERPNYPSASRFDLARMWARENLRIRDYLRLHHLPFIQLGYEELCMAQAAETRRLCEFLKIDWEPSMLDLSRSRSHVLRGNRMRFKAETSGVTYDWRWFYRSEWHLPYMLVPGLRRLNRDLAYRQTPYTWGSE